MSEVLFTVVAILICIIAEGFFSGSEIGVVSADRLRLRHEAANGSKGAKLALKMLEKPEWLLSTTLVGTNISVVTNTTLATALVVSLFGASYSWLAVVFVAPLNWVLGEIVPKSVYQQRANEITPRAIFLLKFFSYVFYPILLVFSIITRFLTRMVGSGESGIFTLREQLISMLHMSGPEGNVTPEQSKMIRQMFKFSDTPVIQAMVPLVDVISVDRSASCAEARELALQSGHKTLVVIDQRVDNVIGMVHTLELLGLDDETPVEAYIRPVKYVGGSKSARELLDDLRHLDDSMAVLVNEFGSARGIVRATDIMQLIVSEYHDEHQLTDDDKDSIRKIAETVYIVNGNVNLDFLNDRLGIETKAGDYSTLAGYLLQKLPDIPGAGVSIQSHDITYTIEESTERRIEKVRITLP
ncbi:MAG: hypothetical protein CSB44_02555 [Gammaproteobacteria bacterium]|nr:MAG: hypothetical protein CSB44_02555 [Gammaproteobacteria bacterium]